MDMNMNMNNSDAAAMPAMKKSYTHMTFFWGAHTEVLFKGWPGARPGMYPLALALVLVLCVALEWLDHLTLASKNVKRGVVTGLAGTAVHAVRVAVSYLVMLALMSFNVGILIAAVVGRALGFFLSRSTLLGGSTSQPGDDGTCSC